MASTRRTIWIGSKSGRGPRSRGLGALLIPLMTLVGATSAQAQTFTFTRVVDSFDINPTSGFEWLFFEPPALHRTNIAFRADSDGVYRSDLLGNVDIVADTATTSPSFGGGTFFSFGQFRDTPQIHGDEVAYVAASSSQQGVYHSASPSSILIAGDESTRFPGQPFGNNISFVTSPSYDGRTSLIARDSTPFNPEAGAFIESIGLGIRPGALAPIVDTLNAVPGESAPFFTVSSVSHARGSAAYVALRNGPPGPKVLRRWSAYRPEHVLIAETGTAMPGHAGETFDFIGSPAVDRTFAQDVCFFGENGTDTIEGIYRGDGHSLVRVADTTMMMPGLQVPFGSFDECSIDAGNVVFTARDATFQNQAVFLFTRLGTLIRVVGDGDMLDGEMVFGASSGDFAIDGNRIAFQAFTSSGESLYVATRSGSGAAALGSSQSNPVLPNSITTGTYAFTNGPSGAWFDPPTDGGFRYTMTGPSRFTEILDFPEGFGVPFRVVANGQVLGRFEPGDSVVFPSGGVASFDVLDILPGFDPGDPEAFPLQLAFDTPTADFEMTTLPEPGMVLQLAVGCGLIAALRRHAADSRFRSAKRQLARCETKASA